MAARKRLRGSDGDSSPLTAKEKEVRDILMAEAVFSTDVVEKEVKAFFNEFGLPRQYFEETEASEVARHVESLQAAKILASASGRAFDIQLQQEADDSAMFASRSVVKTAIDKAPVRETGKMGLMSSPCRDMERYIEDKYLSGGKTAHRLDETASGTAGIQEHYMSQIPAYSLSKPGTGSTSKSSVFRLQCFRSQHAIDPASGSHLRLYFLNEPKFQAASPGPDEDRVDQVASAQFLERPEAERAPYEAVMKDALGRLGPVIRVDRTDTDDSVFLYLAFRSGSTHSYFTGISDVYRSHHMYADEKYVEPFSNGIVVYGFHLKPLASLSAGIGSRIDDLIRDCSLHYVLPRTSLTPLLTRNKLTAQEVAYAYAGWKFAFHFLNRGSADIDAVAASLSRDTKEAFLSLGKIRKSLTSHAFTEGAILDCLFRYPDIVSFLYEDFASLHEPNSARKRTDEALVMFRLNHELHTDMDLQTFSALLSFNRHVVKTNFYRSQKTALCFRLNPAFLPKSEFPDMPHGLFFVIGSEFRGFHIRFRDVARGGIRIVKSAYTQAFANNVSSMFNECYNLANTQQRKNKDIPEGGSKGVVLLNLAYQDKGLVAFRKYVDSILDVILPNDEVVDHLGKEEILFFGPDENTADYMDWACQFAKERGYRFWKAFTTGKSLKLGGIPHDVYGMTTHSVRQYALGIQSKLGLTGSSCFKVQTGGPDGDLGSNEILMGNERTIAVVDGSGVLYDPEGIDSAELKRLARSRSMVKHVNKDKLSRQGFLILVGDKDVKLPNGSVVESGMVFRNTFHFHDLCKADFFIPCGGRPASVDGETVSQFLTVHGLPRFKYIVEGANLFLTQDARLALEDAGTVVIKDATANKGGVTSSSLEVLAALVLTDDEFGRHMAVSSSAAAGAGGAAGAGTGASAAAAPTPPAFYRKYVEEVQKIIDDNARLEFECMWREHERTGEAMSILSDKLSVKITQLSARIEESESLWTNESLRMVTLRDAIPKTLATLVGSTEDVILRLPENYLRALFGSRLASRFIYEHGLNTPEFAFFEFVSKSTLPK